MSTTNRLLYWHRLADAPLSLQDAHELAAKGAIIMAQRYFPERVELLVRPAMDRTTAPGKPSSVREGPVQ
jgi:hypothetical protein